MIVLIRLSKDSIKNDNFNSINKNNKILILSIFEMLKFDSMLLKKIVKSTFFFPITYYYNHLV